MSVSIPGVNAPPFPLTEEKIEEIYNTMLEVQNGLSTIYQELNLNLKKAISNFPFKRPESSSETPKESCSQKEPSSQSSNSATSSSNWMLKHQGPGSGLTELMPHSGIYVSEAELNECNRLQTDMKIFGRLLLPIIFSKKALQKCTLSGRSRLNRPVFDNHIKNTFVNYVTKHARESGWKVVSRQNLLQSCNSKILAMSKKYQYKLRSR